MSTKKDRLKYGYYYCYGIVNKGNGQVKGGKMNLMCIDIVTTSWYN
jgi:hypothetical protein